jgi:hypothetical protein
MPGPWLTPRVNLVSGEARRLALVWAWKHAVVTTFLYVMAGSPLCGPAFLQLARDRTRRRYVVSQGLAPVGGKPPPSFDASGVGSAQ